MHPILTHRSRLLVYLGVWVAFGVQLALVLIFGGAAPVDWSNRESLLSVWTDPKYFDVDKMIDVFGNAPAEWLQAARCEARKATSSATSSGLPGRPIGMPPRLSISWPSRSRCNPSRQE